MGNSKSGIETLLDDVDIFEVVVKEIARREFKREAAARAGKASGARYKRLRDLALKVYLDECENLLGPNHNAQKLIANGASKQVLLNSLRPPFKIFERKFYGSANQLTLEEAEQNWLTRLTEVASTESTLYEWWKKWNADLKLVINEDIYEDAEGNLVYFANSPE